MNEECVKALEKYFDCFNDRFPTVPLFCGNEETIEMIEQCIANGKDVYEMGFLVLDDNILY